MFERPYTVRFFTIGPPKRESFLTLWIGSSKRKERMPKCDKAMLRVKGKAYKIFIIAKKILTKIFYNQFSLKIFIQ